jgi:hypothetical protein
MSINEYLMLARLLVKWRASFALSHRVRDTIDMMIFDCLGHIKSLGVSSIGDSPNEIPF